MKMKLAFSLALSLILIISVSSTILFIGTPSPVLGHDSGHGSGDGGGNGGDGDGNGGDGGGDGGGNGGDGGDHGGDGDGNGGDGNGGDGDGNGGDGDGNGGDGGDHGGDGGGNGGDDSGDETGVVIDDKGPIFDDDEDRYPVYVEVGEVSGSVHAGDVMYVTNPDGTPVMNIFGTPEMGRPLLDENGNQIISRTGAIFYYIGGRVIEVYSGMTIMPEEYPGGEGTSSSGDGTSSDEGGSSSGEDGSGSGEGGSSSGEGSTSSGEGGTSSGEDGSSSGEDGTSSGEDGSVDENVGSSSQGSYPFSPPPGALVRSLVTFNAPAPPRVAVPPGVTERIVTYTRRIEYIRRQVGITLSDLQPIRSPVDDRILLDPYGNPLMGARVLERDGTPVTGRTGIPYWVVTPEVRRFIGP